MAPTPEINPAYLTATYVALLVYPACPTFDEQLQRDAELYPIIDLFPLPQPLKEREK